MQETSALSGGDVASALKGALRSFAQSVVVVTTADVDGNHFAMPATAVTPVSMDPPSMLVCVNRSASSHKILEAGANFCLNILSTDNFDVAQCAGGPSGTDRFAVGNWKAEAGLPYLADAQAVMFCHQREKFSYGSHDIFIGDVRSVIQNENCDPLLYLDGAYRRVGPKL